MPNNRIKEGGNNCRQHKLLDGNEEMEKEGVNQREDILYCFDVVHWFQEGNSEKAKEER